MGHRAPRVLVGVVSAAAVVVSGCGGVTSKPRTAGPVPAAMVVLGKAGSDADPNAGFCAGVVIGPKKVLTAKRCLRKRKVSNVNARVLHPEGCLVTHRRRALDATPVSVGAVTLVKLKAKLPPRAAKSLPVGEVPTEGDELTAWGWGPGRPGGACVPRPERLRVLSEAECADLVGDDGLAVYFCAVPEGTNNTCPGDTGGPVLDEERRLVGVTVAGQVCGTDKPARYWSTANLVTRAG